MGNICHMFFAIFSCASLQSRCYNLYVYFRFFCLIEVPQASPTYFLSKDFAELLPILIHYRTIPYFKTLPVLRSASFHGALNRNSFRRRNRLSASVIYYPYGQWATTGMAEPFLEKTQFFEKKEVSQCRK